MDNNDYIELVKQAQLGNKDSLDALAERARERLYTYVYRIVLQEDLAQDIVQESMFEMFKVLGKLDKADRFWPWLRGIAFNKMRRARMEQRNRRSVSLSSAGKPPPEPRETETGLANLVAEELKQVVITAMGQLKPRYRKVLTMRCYEEMEYSEIAELMGCSELSVRVLFCRAKKALQKQLSLKGFGRGFLVTTLILFGKMTAPSKAAASTISVTASTTKVGMAAAFATAASSKTAILSLTAAGAFAVGTMVMSSGPGKTTVGFKEKPEKSLRVTKPVEQVSKGTEECWFYYPQNVNGPVMMRVVKRDSHRRESYCRWWQDGRANYRFDKSKNTIYINNHRMWDSELSVQRLPTDGVTFREFLSMVEGKSYEMEYVPNKGYGLLVITRRSSDENNNRLRITQHYNVLDEEYFRYKWPAGAKVVDKRDAMHKRGWTYFRLTGEIGGDKVSGTGQIPLVHATSRRHSPWLKLQVGNSLKIVDSGAEACVYDGSAKVVATYEGGSFFKGLARPWMGLHTINTVRRDAVEQRVWFETKHITGGNEAEIELTCEQTKLVYTIDMEKDLIEKITFLTNDGREGELRFSYLQEIEQTTNEFVSPRRKSSKGPQRKQPGIIWLVKLANGVLVKGE